VTVLSTKFKSPFYKIYVKIFVGRFSRDCKPSSPYSISESFL
jgi:hypothetical protein